MALETGDNDPEIVNAVFRAVHSIKGGAGAFGLEELVSFAHVFETALDEMRAGRLAMSTPAVKLMLRASDMLSDHVSAAQGQTPADEQRSSALMAELAALTQDGSASAAAEPPPAFIAVPSAASPGLDSDEPVPDEIGFVPLRVNLDPPPASGWRICFTPASDLYAKANDVTPLVRELERLGPCAVHLNAEGLPDLDVMDPEAAYLNWTIDLSADCSRDAVQAAFEFVDGDCDLTIEALVPVSQAPPAMDLESVLAQARMPSPPPSDGEIQAIIDQVVPSVQVHMDQTKAGASSVSSDHPQGDAAPDAARSGQPSGPQATIRVDLDRVDRLIDLVGELVINQAMLAQRVAESGFARSSTVMVGLDDLEQLTREIQDSVMAIRAQPVKSVFQRIPRLVREIALSTGKRVRLVTEGEGTEVDKTVIERLSDPITHMIRNAVDHGLETPAERVAAGKPEEGVIRLAALHRSGRIVIEVSDDGKGINRPRVRQIAIDKGLIDPDAQLTDDEIDNLLFLPGFSTASTISNISGRGVGMDVVKRSLQALGGRIAIASTPGQGSTFTMSLPLTLAVLDGMVVTVGDQTLVAPLTSIIETLQPKPSDVRLLGPQSRVLAVRDTYAPLIDVGAVLGWREQAANPAEGVCILVENEAGGRAALLVDTIQGQRQVVIKSLEANFQDVPGIAAATILGDGRVALIIDVDAVIALRGKSPASPTFALAS
jgi:two-component system chemotaxis sensor kinase CheA